MFNVRAPREKPLASPVLSLNRLVSARDGTTAPVRVVRRACGEMELSKQDVLPARRTQGRVGIVSRASRREDLLEAQFLSSKSELFATSLRWLFIPIPGYIA